MGLPDWLARTQRLFKNFGPHLVKINVRRVTRNITGAHKPPLAVAVDIDGTLLNADTQRIMAENTGWADEYEKICREVARGKKHMNPALKESFDGFAKLGVGEAEWREVAENAFNDHLNKDLVEGLLALQGLGNAPKLILATRGHRAVAERVAELLLEKHGLHVQGIVASGDNGKGFEIIGNREGRLSGTSFTTKPLKAREQYLRGWGIPLQRTAIITDSPHDADSVAKFDSGVLLLTGEKSNAYALRAGMYDRVLRRGQGRMLPEMLGFKPEQRLKPPSRLM
ncbi:hypothetical protein COX86_01705 [Candidatus Micrarchaeota archaeon CG_4_10_14_0_2_um_filter_60_11]|nr:MAG: hypothetical protein AUJ16_01020 [Candidatus Micrarchaeota archaeon CG1_02_60_51]PIN96111.1 MAG: hypothetical protein COU39_02850 [Candidatus Micrarchaeota archaeon CG10_big_fil_rev_8_21_14_0_10_60_32]PIO01617.1 MAG: hypothetical protein COT58_04470 [Candidatus Micrarchaeota archaeon CG09_land_8_20_14_0_10_60_16]PIY91887.1 MAG: hypothetical protein COY71_00765 [Candidatus Micrarchaeota archaeon CG_4_10_14_0_8_um_filter_60_7]PIZ91061.1 MAG: hypothetical protein COX86_01705 [Candidatus Mi